MTLIVTDPEVTQSVVGDRAARVRRRGDRRSATIGAIAREAALRAHAQRRVFAKSRASRTPRSSGHGAATARWDGRWTAIRASPRAVHDGDLDGIEAME